MPELPEVETIKRGLNARIIGLVIVNLEIYTPKSFSANGKDLIDKEVIGVERRAKTIRIKLSSNLNVLIHLKMTGQLIYINSGGRLAGGHPSHDWHAELPNNHTRLAIYFNDGSKLFFNDMRKFGWARVLTDDEILKEFAKYGPEPDSADFTVNYLMDQARRKPSRTIKQFLMDQSIIAGVGNIYADESLFMAKISPFTRASALKQKDWETISKSLKTTLEKGIKYGGTTDSDYVNVDGNKGGMQDYLAVYNRAGLPCLVCGSELAKAKIGDRGTHYCLKCQRIIR